MRSQRFQFQIVIFACAFLCIPRLFSRCVCVFQFIIWYEKYQRSIELLMRLESLSKQFNKTTWLFKMSYSFKFLRMFNSLVHTVDNGTECMFLCLDLLICFPFRAFERECRIFFSSFSFYSTQICKSNTEHTSCILHMARMFCTYARYGIINDITLHYKECK